MGLIKYALNSFLLARLVLVGRNRFHSLDNEVKNTSRLYDCKVGSYNYFGPGVVINRTNFGNYCSIGPNVIIGGMEHDYNEYSTSTKLCPHKFYKKTVIEDDVWIGAGAVVRTAVTIGKGSVIGDNSIVLQDV